MKEERILTRHPDPEKQGTPISKAKYESMRKALLQVIPQRREGVPFQELTRLVKPRIDPEAFAGASVGWYVVVVKQDLEARGLIEQVPKSRPQRLRRMS